jgi:hypothetical protein
LKEALKELLIIQRTPEPEAALLNRNSLDRELEALDDNQRQQVASLVRHLKVCGHCQAHILSNELAE